MDFAAFRLEADRAGKNVQAAGAIDEFTVDVDFDLIALDLDVILVPFARGFFGALDACDAFELADFFVLDVLVAIGITVEAGAVKAVEVASLAVLQLGFNAFWQEGFGSGGDTHQYPAVGGFGARCPAPFEAELEVLVGGIGVEVAQRQSFADEDTVLNAPDVFLAEGFINQNVRPAVEVLTVEQINGGRCRTWRRGGILCGLIAREHGKGNRRDGEGLEGALKVHGGEN